MISVQHAWVVWLAVAGAALAEDAAKPVVVAVAERAPVVSMVELTGSITAKRQASLSSRASGLVRKVKVDAGDRVKAGEVLMELDDDLARLALERVKVEKEQAALELKDATRLVEEVRDLAKSGAYSRSEAESRETALKVRAVGLERSDVQLKEQEELIERHRLIAPFDGVVSQKLAEEGEWVQTGTPVLELVETDRLWMDVQGPQELYGLLEKEPKVEVRLDAYPNVEFPGKIAVKVPVKDLVARTFLLRIDMEDPKSLASPGMSGRVTFSFEGENEVLQVPRDSVIRFPDGSTKLWIVSEENGALVASSRLVELGRGLGDRTEVMDGIEAGAKVIVRGNEGLREGQRVEISTLTTGDDS
jgi:RND family efflux transporter MFP subunit